MICSLKILGHLLIRNWLMIENFSNLKEFRSKSKFQKTCERKIKKVQNYFYDQLFDNSRLSDNDFNEKNEIFNRRSYDLLYCRS